MEWKNVNYSVHGYTWDIWFTSGQNGFIIGDHLWKTTDGGKYWQVVPNTSVVDNFFYLFFTDPKNGFAYSLTDLAATVDSGSTWVVKPLATDSVLAVFFTDAAHGFYSDRSGGSLWMTTDSGNNWKSILKNTNSPDTYYPFFLNADTGYVATRQGFFYSTTNAGLSWNSNFQPLMSYGTNAVRNSYNQLLFLDNNTGFYAFSYGVLSTNDGGKTWNSSLTNTNTSPSLINYIRFRDRNTGYYKTDNAIYKTSDGGKTWNLSCRVGDGNQLNGLSISDAHTTWACTQHSEILNLQE